MGKTSNMEFTQSDFFKIIKRAYEKGTTDKDITVQKIIEDIQLDFMNVKRV